MAALFAGRKHALERDHALERTRAENHRLRQLLDQAEAEIKCIKGGTAHDLAPVQELP